VTVERELAHDLKLAADRRSQEIILAALAQGSGLPVISEEAGWEPLRLSDDGVWRWIVDPLDGSLNFKQQIPLCCVSIGLWQGDRPWGGVIYDFKAGVMYKGVKGLGAWCQSTPLRVAPPREARRAVLMTGFPSGGDYHQDKLLEFVNQVRCFRKLRLLGSAALSLAYVAAGRADAYLEKGIKLWDVAAGLALVAAAGGHIRWEQAGDSPDLIAYAGAGPPPPELRGAFAS
jgi:myo-inositol-1(or 4)-monophosphatase